MARLTAAITALALGVLAAFALVACGSGSDAKLLPGNTAQEITENLDSVKQLVTEGECVSAEDSAQEISTQVEGLDGIDAKLKQALAAGAERLNEVVESCTEDTTVETVEETVPELSESEKAKPKKTKEPKEEAEGPGEKETGKKTPTTPAEPPEPPGQEKTPPGHETSPGQEESPSGGIGPGAEVQEEGK